MTPTTVPTEPGPGTIVIDSSGIAWQRYEFLEQHLTSHWWNEAGSDSGYSWEQLHRIPELAARGPFTVVYPPGLELPAEVTFDTDTDYEGVVVGRGGRFGVRVGHVTVFGADVDHLEVLASDFTRAAHDMKTWANDGYPEQAVTA